MAKQPKLWSATLASYLLATVPTLNYSSVPSAGKLTFYSLNLPAEFSSQGQCFLNFRLFGINDKIMYVHIARDN